MFILRKLEPDADDAAISAGRAQSDLSERGRRHVVLQPRVRRWLPLRKGTSLRMRRNTDAIANVRHDVSCLQPNHVARLRTDVVARRRPAAASSSVQVCVDSQRKFNMGSHVYFWYSSLLAILICPPPEKPRHHAVPPAGSSGGIPPQVAVRGTMARLD